MKFKNLKNNTFVNAVGDLAQDLLKDKNYRLAVDADFKESEHPRDNDGKFSSGGGGSSKTIEKSKSSGKTSKSSNKLTLKAETVRSEIKSFGIKANVKVAEGGGSVKVFIPYGQTWKEPELKKVLQTMEKNGFTMSQGVPIDVDRQSQMIGLNQFNFHPK